MDFAERPLKFRSMQEDSTADADGAVSLPPEERKRRAPNADARRCRGVF
jgi:hypothetical protein